MRKTEEQKLAVITQMKFPNESYPILYKSYWSEELSDEYKVENNKSGIYIQPLIEVYRNYYNLQFDSTTLSQIVYNNTRTPYQLVFIIRFKGSDKDLYLWEYFDNWMSIKDLNTTKWI